MVKQAPLDEQIIEALTNGDTSRAVAAVRDRAQEAMVALVAQADKADVAALSPLASNVDARKLREQAAELRFDADRLEASVAALSTRTVELIEQEERRKRDDERAAALAERDALAAEIAERYPRLVRDMTDLVKRIGESDAACARVGIRESAEAIGRGVPAHFRTDAGPIMRMRETTLPMPSETWAAWHQRSIGGELVYRGLTITIEEEA